MNLEPEAFNELLQHMGQDVSWRRSYACPCVSPRSGAPAEDCPACDGKGKVWDEGVDTRIGVAGRDVQQAWVTFGKYEQGDQVVIVGSDSPAYAIGPFDRVLALNRTEPFSANFTRGVNERIRFPVDSIERVMYLDADRDLVDVPIPVIDADGGVLWGEGGGPPPAVTYSMTGRRKAEFFVFGDLPFDRPHHAGALLPRRVVLRRFDLFSR